MLSVYLPLLIIIAYPLYLISKWLLTLILLLKDDQRKEQPLSAEFPKFPSDLKPYYVDALINNQMVPTGRSISSTILYLIKQRYIKIGHKDNWTAAGTRKRKYFLVLDEKRPKDIAKLPQIEQRFLSFIFQGKGNIATFAEIKSYGIRKAAITHKFWKYWEDQIVFNMIEKNYFDEDYYFTSVQIKREIYITAAVFLSSLIFIQDLGFELLFAVSAVLIFILVVLHFFKFFMYKRTGFGEREYTKWMALKNWMENFSVTKNYAIDSLVLWEDYLIYGVALGVSEKALSQLPVDFEVVKLDRSVFGEMVMSGESIEGDYTFGLFVGELLEFASFIAGRDSSIEAEEIELQQTLPAT